MRNKHRITWIVSLLCLIGGIIWAGATSAEELRMFIVQGTTSDQILAEFKQMIQQKYQVQLNITVNYWVQPDEIYQALRNKTVDIISCPHNIPKDADFKLIAGKLLLPVDLANITNYADIIPALQKPDFLTEGDQVYGVSYAYSPYGLAYNSAKFSVPPTTWKVLWDPQYAGQYAISSGFYELNALITGMSLGLDRTQLGQFEAINTPEFQTQLQALAKNAGSLWTVTDTADDLQGKTLAAAWGYSFQELNKRGEEWHFATPVEGTSVGIGSFAISHTLRENPTMKRIAEEWLNFAISPTYQKNVILGAYFPVNLKIKDEVDPATAAYFHLDAPNYFKDQMIPWPTLDKRTRTAFELFWTKATR